MLLTKFRFIWSIGFRGENFLESDQSEPIIACGAMFVNRLKRNEQA